MSVSAARGVAAKELGALIDSSVNKEGLPKLPMLQEFSEELYYTILCKYSIVKVNWSLSS